MLSFSAREDAAEDRDSRVSTRTLSLRMSPSPLFASFRTTTRVTLLVLVATLDVSGSDVTFSGVKVGWGGDGRGNILIGIVAFVIFAGELID